MTTTHAYDHSHMIQPTTQQGQRTLMMIICMQATIAMLGSLYYGFYGDPVANMWTLHFFDTTNALIPCELCWYARILMYPIVWMSGIALIRRRYDIVYTILPVALVGICLEIYHYVLQKVPTIETRFECTGAKPCDALNVDYFGFITIPFLCLVAFIVIAICSIILIKQRKNNTKK